MTCGYYSPSQLQEQAVSSNGIAEAPSTLQGKIAELGEARLAPVLQLCRSSEHSADAINDGLLQMHIQAAVEESAQLCSTGGGKLEVRCMMLHLPNVASGLADLIACVCKRTCSPTSLQHHSFELRMRNESVHDPQPTCMILPDFWESVQPLQKLWSRLAGDLAHSTSPVQQERLHTQHLNALCGAGAPLAAQITPLCAHVAALRKGGNMHAALAAVQALQRLLSAPTLRTAEGSAAAQVAQDSVAGIVAAGATADGSVAEIAPWWRVEQAKVLWALGQSRQALQLLDSLLEHGADAQMPGAPLILSHGVAAVAFI